MSKSRRIYIGEYKSEAVKLLFQQGISAGEARRHLGIGSNLIVRWKKEIYLKEPMLFLVMAGLSRCYFSHSASILCVET